MIEVNRLQMKTDADETKVRLDRGEGPHAPSLWTHTGMLPTELQAFPNFEPGVFVFE